MRCRPPFAPDSIPALYLFKRREMTGTDEHEDQETATLIHVNCFDLSLDDEPYDQAVFNCIYNSLPGYKYLLSEFAKPVKNVLDWKPEGNRARFDLTGFPYDIFDSYFNFWNGAIVQRNSYLD